MCDCSRLAPVGNVELAEDVRDVDAGGLDADDERRRDLPIRVAPGDERQDFRFARGQPEDLLEAVVSFVRLRRREIEASTLGEQLELAQ